MTNAPTPRETADHAELARIEDVADWFESGDPGANGSVLLSASVAAEHASDLRFILSEIAALRASDARTGELLAESNIRESRATVRATQAGRQRDELRKALEPFADIGGRYRTGGLRQDIESRSPSLMRLLDFKAFRHADSLLANQGAD